MAEILGNAIGFSFPKTYMLIDESGNEFVGVVTDSVQMFDATPADVKINKTFVSDKGIQVGENTITYRTAQGTCAIFAGEEFVISTLRDHNQYDYTQLQCIIAPYNTTFTNSVAADKVVLQNSVYPVNSTEALSVVSKDSANQAIKLNIINNTEDDYVIHYFTCKEEI